MAAALLPTVGVEAGADPGGFPTFAFPKWLSAPIPEISRAARPPQAPATWVLLSGFVAHAHPVPATSSTPASCPGGAGDPKEHFFFPPLFVCRDGSRSQPCHNNLPLAFPCVSPVSVLVSSTSSPWLSSGVPRVSSGAQHRARSRLCFGALGGAPLNGRAPGGACCLRGHVLPFVPGLCREDRCRALGGVEMYVVPPPPSSVQRFGD